MFNKSIISMYLNEFFNKHSNGLKTTYNIETNGEKSIKINFYSKLDLETRQKQIDFAKAIKKICKYIEFKVCYCSLE